MSNVTKVGSGVLLVAILYVVFGEPASLYDDYLPEQRSTDSSKTLYDAFINRASDLQVSGSGKVVRVLSDDNDGSRHQRFILQVSPDQTVLVAHNIDLAPRISGLEIGDRVAFNGEYEWNADGGVIHWTHHDPQGRHVGGWLKHRGETYQ